MAISKKTAASKPAKKQAAPAKAIRAAKPKKLVLPKSMGEAADLLYKTRADRLAMQKEVDAIETLEKALTEHIINNLPKSKQEGAAGKVARVTIEKKKSPVVKDWDKLYAHISKTKQFDLLNRALNRKAVKERWEAKKVIPGVGDFTSVTLSVTAK